MAKELAFVLINPIPVMKSRTGGILARYLVRTDLKLVGARMVGPSLELVQMFADHLEGQPDTEDNKLLADYVRRVYAPDPETGLRRRCIFLLFEGEDAVRKIAEVTGKIKGCNSCGKSVRDTFGDRVTDPETGRLIYFEPAVLIASTPSEGLSILKIWADFLPRDAGIVEALSPACRKPGVERTLVMLKPDNWKKPSLRAGAIIDLLSNTELELIGMKKFSMSVAQAERFYGPVKEGLKEVFGRFGASRSAEALSREFGFQIEPRTLDSLVSLLAPLFAEQEFEKIVQFMTGRAPSTCPPAEKELPGSEECLALIYEGENAIRKVRDQLGATNPLKARSGTIRSEFGTNIMVNAAHASDSPENAKREMEILDVENDPLFAEKIRTYIG